MPQTSHWLPYEMQLHSAIRSLQPCDPSGRYTVLLRSRDAKGKILQEHALCRGEAVTGVSSLTLDFSVLERSMREAGEGLVEAVFTSEEPFLSDGYNYYFGQGGFTLYANGPQLSFNPPNKTGRYRGFSVHLITPGVRRSGLVLMNVSTDPAYSRIASFRYEVLNPRGEVVQEGVREIPPFGTCWLALEEKLLAPEKETMYTMFGRCDGSTLVSLIYTAMEGGGLGIDHTAPPIFQSLYGQDLTPGFKRRYLRIREKLGRKVRYAFNRFE